MKYIMYNYNIIYQKYVILLNYKTESHKIINFISDLICYIYFRILKVIKIIKNLINYFIKYVLGLKRNINQGYYFKNKYIFFSTNLLYKTYILYLN